MKVKYKEGDIFVIPLSNGKYAICHIFFAPSKKFKQAIGFCILSIQQAEELIDGGSLTPLSFERFGKETKVSLPATKISARAFGKLLVTLILQKKKTIENI